MCWFEFKMPLVVLPANNQKIPACIKRKYWFTNSGLRFIPNRGWQLWYKMSCDISIHSDLCMSVELDAAQHSEWPFLVAFSLFGHSWWPFLSLWLHVKGNCTKSTNPAAGKGLGIVQLGIVQLGIVHAPRPWTPEPARQLTPVLCPFVQSTEGHLTASGLRYFKQACNSRCWQP